MALTKVGKEGITGISNSSDATAITIDSSETVGIGLSSPLTNYKIHVDANSDSDGRVARFSQAGTDNAIVDVTAQNGTNTEAFSRYRNDANFFSVGIDGNDNFSIGKSFANTIGNTRVTVLSGGGLTFNGDTAAANALGDYEEGTWTPSVRGSTTNGSFSGSNTVGFYTKIGDTVHAWFDCDGTISGAAGIILFTGLPYASISTVEAVGQFMFSDLNTVDATRTNHVLYLGGNSTEMSIFASKDDAAWVQVDITNESIGIRAQITYKTP
jgi:hypothetical protein